MWRYKSKCIRMKYCGKRRKNAYNNCADGCISQICYFLVTIGKRFKDAGLRDVVVESVVNRSCTRRQNFRLHKIFCEALQRLIWKGFYSSIETYHSEDSQKLQEAHNESADLKKN